MVKTHVVGRLGSELRVSASFQIILRPVDRLGLGSRPHVVGRLGSGPRVGQGQGDYLRGGGIFGRGGCLRGSCFQVLSARIQTHAPILNDSHVHVVVIFL